MNLFAPDHRTSHTASPTLARLATGRVLRLNSEIFLLIRLSVCPPRHLCTCSSQPLMYVLSSLHPLLSHSLHFNCHYLSSAPSSSPLPNPFHCFWLSAATQNLCKQTHHNFISAGLAITITCAHSDNLFALTFVFWCPSLTRLWHKCSHSQQPMLLVSSFLILFVNHLWWICKTPFRIHSDRKL